MKTTPPSEDDGSAGEGAGLADRRTPLARSPEEQSAEEDARLVARILSGDEAAFAELVERHRERLFRVVHGILGDWQRSEDTLQEVFVNVHLKLGQFRADSRLSTWLYRIAVNKALKVRGKRARRSEVMFEVVPEGSGRPDERAEHLESSEVIDKLLRPLQPHLRAVVLLKECEGLTYREIAEVIGCSVGAVEQRLHRAFCALREIWKDRGVDFGRES